MPETNDPTIANHAAAGGEGPEAALSTTAASTQPLTLSDAGTVYPTMSDTYATLHPTMSDTTHTPAEVAVPDQPPESPSEPSDSGEKRTANGEERCSAPVKLCRHILEDGVYCQVPALSGRPYCYRHLRLRGQQMRMARALAQRQPFTCCCLRWRT